jgi:hypothetical protein
MNSREHKRAFSNTESLIEMFSIMERRVLEALKPGSEYKAHPHINQLSEKNNLSSSRPLDRLLADPCRYLVCK